MIILGRGVTEREVVKGKKWSVSLLMENGSERGEETQAVPRGGGTNIQTYVDISPGLIKYVETMADVDHHCSRWKKGFFDRKTTLVGGKLNGHFVIGSI